ncbi:MAG: F(420)-0:gamma-glutamyl ligase F420 coenzyme biosynthesis enzyme CofE [Candidatus Methanohalarchaeum thermophilum]|uniref:F(420)-0:gamma-glutamyl ligase F420 coenzyme biosynthesis enzyme CofE n=1 Tax=Methanohalarchaeum thermophilum TaxID=1903181 RepID=A0A1Q6DXU1_METT1|nr:MAG: F(420)-0:gamma-glutamyl ligase F420 coenzyme biosynthesis enzyme CofE [Candidatus Methanohalarchaeum thermophilum]
MAIQITGLKLPIINEGDEISQIIKDEREFEGSEILVIAHSIISKANGQRTNLKDVDPGERAKKLAKKSNKDPRVCELIIKESNVIKIGKDFIITEKNNRICANAGIDKSNAGKGNVLLPPKKPNQEAEKILKEIDCQGVIISDSIGRPFRKGAVGTTIGYAGLKPFSSYKGLEDLYGRKLETTVECVADELAASANLVFGEASKSKPVAVIEGFKREGEPRDGKIEREKNQSVFR